MRITRTAGTIVITVLVLCGLTAAYFYRTGISEALSSVKLVPEPEPYTELYFDNADSLPTSTTAGQPMAFSFTIHNVEGTSTVYPYEVYFQYPNGAPFVIARDSVTLADGASTTIDVLHTFKPLSTQGKIVVDLTSLKQQIDFIVNNPYE
jgi:hypothetical protein